MLPDTRDSIAYAFVREMWHWTMAVESRRATEGTKWRARSQSLLRLGQVERQLKWLDNVPTHQIICLLGLLTATLGLPFVHDSVATKSV